MNPMNESVRLLYVDDDRINTLLFVETCRPARHLQVRTAATGDEALQTARTAELDVLVVDMHLPDTDGLALLARLREVDGLEQVPAFLCTAEHLSDVSMPAARAGYSACWSKPVSLQDVLADLTRVCLRA